jgi:PRA1 family protein 1
MPRWGRPPGVWQGSNQARRRATQWEDFDGVRFEEIDSEDDGYNGSLGRMRRNGNNGGRASPREVRLRSNGFDYESEVSDGVDYDLDDDADSTVAYAMQLAMRDKEEMLVEKALERIRRAQMLGKKNVRLSQEELDALERRRKGTGNKKITVPTTIGSGVRSRAPSINDKRPMSKDSFSKSSSPRSASDWRQGLQEQYESSGMPKRPTSGIHSSMNSSSPTSSSSRPRTPTMQSLRPQSLNGSPLAYQSVYNQRFPSERELPFVRSLPDDPQWAPRQRSSSNALPFPYDNPLFMQQQFGAGNLDPRQSSFQGRRFAPDMSPFNTNPPAATPNQPRREAANPAVRHIPIESSEDESSNNDSASDDDDDDNDVDEGVQVKPVTPPPAKPTNTKRTATAGNASRVTRGTRRRRGR